MMDILMTTETLDRWLDNLVSRGQKPAVIQFQKERIEEFSYEDLTARRIRSLPVYGNGASRLARRFAFLAGSGYRWSAACLGTIKAGAVPVHRAK